LGQSLILPDPETTESLASALAAALPADAGGWTILLQGELGAGKSLQGELGAGKSTFARAMLHALGHEGTVPSPTYTLVEPYALPAYPVYHIDLYRISSSNELEFLGWSDLQDGLKLVEWPERAPQLGKEADIRIELRYEGHGRAADLTALSERGAQALAAFAHNS
jgi:tRNA threonylcarbamoyladenosine biosynthesis protein TsaE